MEREDYYKYFITWNAYKYCFCECERLLDLKNMNHQISEK